MSGAPIKGRAGTLRFGGIKVECETAVEGVG